MSRRTVLPGPWAALAAAFGGVAALAAVLGVAPVTLWRWGRGADVPGPAALAVAALAKKKRLPSPEIVRRALRSAGATKKETDAVFETHRQRASRPKRRKPKARIAGV